MTEKLVFTGYDASGLYGLFISDGTAAGTTELPVNGAYTTSVGLYPFSTVYLNGKLYFDGSDTSGNGQLWVSNGTTAGTSEILVPGLPNGLGPNYLTVFDGKL